MGKWGEDQGSENENGKGWDEKKNKNWKIMKMMSLKKPLLASSCFLGQT